MELIWISVNVHELMIKLFLLLYICISEPLVDEKLWMNFAPLIYTKLKFLADIAPEVL